MRCNFILFLLVCFTEWTSAQKVGVKSPLGLSCLSCSLDYDFGCPKVFLPLNCPCRNTDFLVTVMDCIMTNAKDINDAAKALKFARDQCHYWGNHTMTLAEMEQLYNEKKNTLVEAGSYTSALAPGPVKVPHDFYEEQLISAKNGKFHYHVGDCFAFGCVGYWAAVVIMGTLANMIRIMNPKFYDVFGFKRVTWIRKHMTLPASIGTKHQSPWRFLCFSLYFPTRGQSLIILGAVGMNIASIVAFLGTKGPTPLTWSSHSDRVLHYLANRTGIIAFGHIPLLVLFSCRNNPLIYLTGWPYNTFMIYHRWCARFMGIHAVIHSVAIYWTSFNEKTVLLKWRNVHNWQAGNIATYMAILMLILSLRQFRARFYEFFKATHVVMFWIFIVCVVVHCSDYGWLGWIWASFVFYGIEYAGRIARMILSGGFQEAEFITHDPNSGLYKIKVEPGKRRWNVRPGCYVYIMICDKDLFWQFHPFSVFQSFNEKDDGSLYFCCKAQDGITRKIVQKLVASGGSFKRKVLIEGPYGHGNYVTEYDSVLLFAGGVGFSAMYAYAVKMMDRLKPNQHLCLIWVIRDVRNIRIAQKEVNHLYKNHGHTCDFRIYITRADNLCGWGTDSDIYSDPAGIQSAHESRSIESPNNSGVEVESSRVPNNEVVQNEKGKSSESSSDNNSSKNIIKVEVDSDGSDTRSDESDTSNNNYYSMAEMNSAPDAAIAAAVARVSQMHTSLKRSTQISSKVEVTERDIMELGENHHLINNVTFERPNIPEVVADFIKTASGTKSVVSCGPPMFVDNIREGVIRSIFESDERIDYFEDAFSW